MSLCSARHNPGTHGNGLAVENSKLRTVSSRSVETWLSSLIQLTSSVMLVQSIQGVQESTKTGSSSHSKEISFTCFIIQNTHLVRRSPRCKDCPRLTNSVLVLEPNFLSKIQEFASDEIFFWDGKNRETFRQMESLRTVYVLIDRFKKLKRYGYNQTDEAMTKKLAETWWGDQKEVIPDWKPLKVVIVKEWKLKVGDRFYGFGLPWNWSIKGISVIIEQLVGESSSFHRPS